MIGTAAALAIVVASIPIAAVGWIRTRQFRVGIGILLDLWVAAGLLRLSEDATWQRIAGAAALIGVRKLVIFSLAVSRRRTS
ncbi:MAG: hypothetical protein HOV81_06775 [Kofleriaceae bacterium]|nr:hypothetical protein [Kofleriaceae bacterium]